MKDSGKEVKAMIILETRNLRKTYGQGEARIHALDGVDLTVEKGEFTAIVGTSGSGRLYPMMS